MNKTLSMMERSPEVDYNTRPGARCQHIMIHVDGIKRQFGGRVLFEQLSWMIPRGAALGLVGPNGSGKTTLMRIVAGHDAPDAGQVRRPGSARVGLLAQEVETVERGTVLSVVLSGFEAIRRLEEEMEDAERRMANMREGDPELERAAEAYGERRHRYEQLGGDRVESRAREILSGLGVPVPSFHAPIEQLSGGWRMRVVLARLLLGEPDLLLLDEPTNHLDLEAIAWLEGFLESFPGTLVVVSHDRYFLNRMVDGIVELDRGTLTAFHGTYDDYLVERESRAAAREDAARRQARDLARTERFIERFRYKASKARQVQARVRALSKIDRIEAPRRARSVRFAFPPAPRSGDVVVRLEGVSKSFGANNVYDDLDLTIRRGDRVALVGPNGAGKSTLLKLLSGKLERDGGNLALGHNVTVQYFAQHQLDALRPEATALEEMAGIADAATRPRLRSILGSFLFTGDDVDKKVAVLSGGEKTRLALARMLLHRANLLLLDEPTNHLDLASREVLEEALDEYRGTLVVVSHDRYFINRIATSIGVVEDGTVRLVPGDYDSFLEDRKRRETPVADAPEKPSPARSTSRELRRAEAEERNRRYRERRAHEEKLEPVEREIHELESRLGEIDAEQADPSLYRDPDRARDLGRERAAATARLDVLYERWEDLASEEDR